MSVCGLQSPSDLDGVDQWDSLTGTSQAVPRAELLLNYDAYETTSAKEGGMKERSNPIGALISSGLKLLVNEYNVSWYRPDMYDYEVGDHAECVDVYTKATQADVLLFDLQEDPYER